MYRIIGADGREYGPISAAQLRQWITEGRANAQTRALAEGTADWKPLGQFPEFSFLISPPPTYPAAMPAYGPPRRTNPFAITGFVCGVLSFSGGLCCFGYVFLILGIVFSIVGLSQIKSNPELYDGKGIAIAGLVLSILGLLISFGFMLLLFFASLIGEQNHHVYRL